MNKNILLPALMLLAACTAQIPSDYTTSDEPSQVYPDYADVVIPSNIAPLNFEIKTEGDAFVTHIHARQGKEDENSANSNKDMIVSGKVLDIPLDDWHALLAEAQGDSIFFDIYVQSQGRWTLHPSLRMAVREPIDSYATYRLIEPSYVNFEVMRISQRCLESFDEADIFNNQAFASDQSGQCMNCHNAQDWNRGGHWQMHVRIDQGGTLIADGNSVTKVNLKLPETISAGVYPAWHPSLPLIVYSNNTTMQGFHNVDHNKIEVQDAASDLILYDLNAGTVDIVANDTTEWETFPAWSPDGKWLYYVSATVPELPREELDNWRYSCSKDIKYNIYRRSFDESTHTFGPVDTVYMASRLNASATLPRISPDGRFLLFTEGEYGTFHIWHHDADLKLLEISTGKVRPLTAANSDDTESYHSWSSNSRWILFSSRRDDGSYTRLYISYFDANGRAHKPFLLPQRDPRSNLMLYKSYNVAELIAQPVTTPRTAIINALERDPVQAKLKE